MRLLQEQDIAIAAELSAEAGWNQTEDDWRMLLRLDPENCFGIDADGRLVSTATLMCYRKQLGWIGMVLTHTAYRRRGFARTLLLHTIARADQLGIESLKLDATDQGQPIYESLGFRVEQPVERWWRPKQTPCGASTQPAKLLDHDLHAYGADRSELLRSLTERSKVQASADGFCLSRPGRRANYIGPCISQSAEFARRSVEALSGEESYWDLLPQNQSALTTATELGFQPQRKLIRMVRGRDLRGREDWIYAIAGFELG
jgi:GNAT superfamily N-acetyltransferase